MKSALKKVSLILAICFVAFHLYTAAFGTMPGIAQKSIHLGFLLVIFYINAMVDSEKRWEQIFSRYYGTLRPGRLCLHHHPG